MTDIYVFITGILLGLIVSCLIAYKFRHELYRLLINHNYFQKHVTIVNFDSDILTKFKMHVDYEIDYYSISPITHLIIYNKKLYQFLVLKYGTAI